MILDLTASEGWVTQVALPRGLEEVATPPAAPSLRAGRLSWRAGARNIGRVRKVLSAALRHVFMFSNRTTTVELDPSDYENRTYFYKVGN